MLRAAVVAVLIVSTSAVVRWEERTLKCDVDDCQLAIRNDTFKPAACFLNADARHSCDISCEGADRDSVISKSPTTNRRCIRFYTYNTERSSGGWQMWRQGACAKETIVLQVHCGFPIVEDNH
ncbi:hypothetical protein Y032_0006g2806 [Ancylostoma ceylanicum]|uniref:DUF7808 domain-containing protein n=1 Tax=Ancylostoma ceylanicum TaxID=53326 RepID=A0A016VQW0_9BILA|nr:hypothetical protein Y032_0006g2806 [Ancylostoma ceylanicum]